MNRFMIGQYGCYDQKKHLRDFRDGFYGVEACLLGDEDIKKLLHTVKSEKFCLGIHFPFELNGGNIEILSFYQKINILKEVLTNT